MQATIAIDATPAVLAAVRTGLSVLPDFLVREELAAGRLVQILPEWRLPPRGIYTGYPRRMLPPPKVTSFVEMLIAAEQQNGAAGEGRER
ncbi:LysR substrate-binding domain-containing protein [Mesorhizobium mediterraneum]|uniref:LysR substrate-binding domain-containing protein n=1 Tax=Mesorhizobium mediterraneum TaxID=43617 RepID=UPI00177B3E85|nr:LysR substrate-binding domain-containing protein [Mesorhizobium mediterraneum]